MRIDKLTTKFQQALGDAQSVAVGQDNQFIEPLHLLAALLDQEDGTSASLLSRAGVNVPRLREATKQAGDAGRLLKETGASKKAIDQAIKAVRGGESVGSQEAEGSREALKK